MRASILAIWLFAFACIGAEVPKAPVPNSPFIAVVYRYADTLLERGRNTNDPSKKGVFFSAMDRNTLAPLTTRPPAPTGVHEMERTIAKDGSLTSPNPQHDENLLRVLYTLSELTTKPKYREAADAELGWFMSNMPSIPKRDFEPGAQSKPVHARTDRIWMLWDHCFEVSPAGHGPASWYAAMRFNLFEPGEGLYVYGPHAGMDVTRRVGHYLRTMAMSYAKPKSLLHQEDLQEMEFMLEHYDEKAIKASNRTTPLLPFTNTVLVSRLSFAMDCAGAAYRVPEPLAAKLRAAAAQVDADFCTAPHRVMKAGGFATGGAETQLWMLGAARATTAQVGMMCVSRYENGGNKDFLPLITAAADQYLDSLPPSDVDVWPMTLGHAISLELASWRHTAKPEYLARARKLGEWSVEKFWGTNALPRASLKSDHYETVTGADSLALALMELHLNILHITAVRCPSNTID